MGLGPGGRIAACPRRSYNWNIGKESGMGNIIYKENYMIIHLSSSRNDSLRSHQTKKTVSEYLDGKFYFGPRNILANICEYWQRKWNGKIKCLKKIIWSFIQLHHEMLIRGAIKQTKNCFWL